MKGRHIIRNQKGFTLIEIIAVLVLIGILAAVAVPKYMNLTSDAKAKAAMGEVAEIKSTLSLAYSKLLMSNNGTEPTTAQVVTASGLGTFSLGTAPDIWVGTVSAAGAIVVTSRGGDAEYTATGTWVVPVSN